MTIHGYLRSYTRRNGEPGLSLAQQRALARRIAEERLSQDLPWRYHEETDTGWPVLREQVMLARVDADPREDAEPDDVLIIPTLDGVRLNLSFLKILADNKCNGAPICIFLGWDVTAKLQSKRNYWDLTDGAHWSAFNEMLMRAKSGQRGFSQAIKDGLRRAKDRGVPLGARQPGAHRFTAEEVKRGGRTTAQRRRAKANEPYKTWITTMINMRRKKPPASFGQIAKWLAGKVAKTGTDRRISPMLVWRILSRIDASPTAPVPPFSPLP
jgi:hypothetical protein